MSSSPVRPRITALNKLKKLKGFSRSGARVQTLHSGGVKRKFSAWLPTLLWLALLAACSSDIFSADHTGRILLKIIHTLYGPVSHDQLELINFVVRKTAHFTGYGLLGFFAFFSWRTALPALRWWLWTGLGLALTLTAASLDELHQRFVASRTSSPEDVLLDMAGAVFFQLLIIASITYRHRRSLEVTS
jgi:VanZ family protein